MNNEFIKAAKTGDVEKVRLLLTDPRVDPSANNNVAIQQASHNGHLEVVRLLLTDPRTDPAADDNDAIQWASRNGHLEVVRLLLTDPRTDPAANNNFAIQWASINGHLEVVRLLLTDPRPDPAADNNDAIRWASEYGHLEVVRLLLTDPRVDWRYANAGIRNELIKNDEKLLKTELTTSYLSLERSSPQTILGRKKSEIPKEILKQTAYLGPYQELCEVIHNTEIPPVKLVALAKILKVEHDNKIEWSKLCDKVKHAIFVSLYLHN
jgi:ankyrin repeat protein